MGRYYFHLRDGHDELLDPDGQWLTSMDAVASVALREARALIAADALTGVIDLDQRIEVLNEDSATVYVISFKDALRIVCSA